MSHELNPQQKEAATCPISPLLIVAGAGTGKTTTLTSRLIHLIESGIPASKICAITFTNKAAKEMADRICDPKNPNDIRMPRMQLPYSDGFVDSDRGSRPFIGTFHGLGASILRREAKLLGRTSHFVIFDDHDSFDLVKKIVKKELARGEDDAPKEKPSFFSRKISEIKNTDSTLRELQISSKPKDGLILKTYSAYESGLKDNNAFDFDDLIEKVVYLFKEHLEILKKYQTKFQAILVDEYQDVNPKQYELIKLLAGDHKNLSVVGDDEQMIYGWRYANLKIFLGFERDWPNAQIKLLEENYRSTQSIVGGATAVASNNNYRRPKNLWTKNKPGEPIKVFEAFDENHEAEWISLQIANCKLQIANKFDNKPLASSHLPSTAILYRTNAQSRAIEQALIRNHIPYRIFGGLRFYERKEIKDIIAALRSAVNSKDEISRERLQKNIPKKKLQKFFEEIGSVKNKKLSPVRWIEIFLETTGYLEELEKGFMNYSERQENIGELLSFAARFEDPSKFLQDVALMQPADRVTDNKRQEARRDENEIRLMTIHLAKGLEFDAVFIAGCSEGLLPHAMSMENEYHVEEERRLMYVAMTRARKSLSITFYNTPSRFISEIPEELVKLDNSPEDDADTADEDEYVTLD